MGTNTIYGTIANDMMNGSTTDDIIYGDNGNDTIYGDSGNDVIYGGKGSDYIVTGNGNNYVDGGYWAKDTISCGSGNDTVVYDPMDVVSGGAGIDTLTASASPCGLINWDIRKFSDFENFIGTKYNDTICWSNNATFIDGGGGENTLSAASEGKSVVMDATSGKFANFTTLIGGYANDTIIGGNANETLIGGAGNDILIGGAGNNILIGGTGADTLSGGTGSDVYKFEGVWGNDTITFDASNVNDSILFGSGITASSLSFIHNGTSVIITATNYGTITITDWDDSKLNTLTFSDGSTLSLTDALKDIPIVSIITGTSAADVIQGTVKTDTIYGGAGNDTIYGNGGDDIIYGGTGSDYIVTGNGNNYVEGGYWGKDTISCGSGNDTVVYDPMDVVSGGAGIDTLTAAPDPVALTMWDIRKYSDFENFIGTNYNDTMCWSDSALSIDGGGGVNTLTAASNTRAVVMDATSGKFVNFTNLIGSGKDDTIIAGSASTTMNGGAGNDKLFGSIGNDTLNGGAGNDTLSGGSGSDTYSFDGVWGNDVITYDTSNLNDTIHFGSGITKSNISATKNGTNAVITAAGYGSITIDNWDSAKLENLAFSDGTTVTLDSYLPAATVATTATLASSVSTNKNYALLVGIDQYKIWQLNFTGESNNIADMKTFLSNDDLWENTTTTTLEDSQATKANTLAALSTIAKEASTGDDVLVYYSSHGNLDGVNAYDAVMISPTTIYSAIKDIGTAVGTTGHVTLIVEACDSGIFADYFKSVGAGSQYTVLTSSSAEKVSYATSTNGIFTHFLADNALNAGAADANKDGSTTTGELYSYLSSISASKNYTAYGDYGCSPQFYDGSNGSYKIA